VLTFILNVVQVVFLGIPYDIQFLTCKVTEAYEVEHISHILVYEFEYLTKKGELLVIKVAFSQAPGWFHGSKVQ